MLSKRITYLRKKYNYSQSDLASMLNTSPSAIGMYEQGRRTPNLEILVQLSKLFGVSLDYLVTGAEFTHPEQSPTNQPPDDCPCNICFWKDYRSK